MGLKTVFKVDVSCDKCKKEVLRIVTKIEGVNKIDVDMEKGTVTVVGDVDPFVIIKFLRKAGKNAEFLTVGPPPKPDSQKTDKEKCIERSKKIFEKICEKCPNVFQDPWLNPDISQNPCSIKPGPTPGVYLRPSPNPCSNTCSCPNPCSNPCPSPRPSPTPTPNPCIYRCPYPCSCSTYCKPYGFVTMDYEEPTPPCSIM